MTEKYYVALANSLDLIWDVVQEITLKSKISEYALDIVNYFEIMLLIFKGN